MKPKWTEFIVKQTMNMSGACVAQIVQLVSELADAKLLYATGVEGALDGDLPVNQILPTSEFIQSCLSVKQFDWADIYFVKENSGLNVANLEQINNYPHTIGQSVATIRVVDSEYFYIYVLGEKSMRFNRALNLLTEPRTGDLSSFVFPI